MTARPLIRMTAPPRRLVDMFHRGRDLGLSGLVTAAFFWLVAALWLWR